MDILSFKKINAQFEKALHIIKKGRATRNSAIGINNVARFSADTIITGVLVCTDNCFFDGQIDGHIEVINKLVLGKNSEVNGTVNAGDLMAKGKINGNIIVNNKAIYCSTSIIIADILQTNLLVVESGAVLNLSSLLMQLDGVTVPSFVSKREQNLMTDNRNKSKMEKADAHVHSKTSSELRSTNKNDDTLLFQFFQSKENNLK